MGFGYAFMSPPPPRGGIRTGKGGLREEGGRCPGGPGAASQLPARSVGGGYSPPLEVLDKAVLAADWAAEAAEAGDADPASAPFTFW